MLRRLKIGWQRKGNRGKSFFAGHRLHARLCGGALRNRLRGWLLKNGPSILQENQTPALQRHTPPPGTVGVAEAADERASGATLLSGVAIQLPGCASVRLASTPGSSRRSWAGTAAYGFPVKAELGGSSTLAAVTHKMLLLVRQLVEDLIGHAR
jgi:hypothetical protein